MRTILSGLGSVLVAFGLALGLGGVAILAFGPPDDWLDDLPETSTLVEDTSAADVGRLRTQETAAEPGIAATPVAATAAPVPIQMSPDGGQGAARVSSADRAATTLEASASPTAPDTGGAAAPVAHLPITGVVIPRISLRADVAPAELVESGGGLTWEVPAFKAGHAEATAGAGGLGNAVLLGHVSSRNAGNVFRDLDGARVGDRVQVLSGAQQFDYRVAEVRAVPRTDVSILQPTRTASLSLVTCTGVWLPLLRDYAERLVVRAELAAGVSAAIPQPSPMPPQPVPAALQPSSEALASPRLRTVLDEHFVDHRRGWSSDPQETAWFVNGAYRMFARQPGRFVAIGAPIAEPPRDVVVSGRFRKVGGPAGGGYGLIVRDQGLGPRDGKNQGGRYYVFEVGDRGEMGIWRREEDHWIELLPWTPSDAVRPGTAPNELTVRAVGQQLTFLVNGKEVASRMDAVLPDGHVGIFVGGDLNEVIVERFVVQVPDE